MNPKNLLTALEIENLLGKKYFYRQNIYRLSEEEKVTPYVVEGTLYFSLDEVENVVLKRMALKIRRRIPETAGKNLKLRINREEKSVQMFLNSQNFQIQANTDEQTEEDFLKKIEKKREEVNKMPDFPIDEEHEGHPPPPKHGHKPPPHHGPPRHGPKHSPHHGSPPHEEVLEMLRRIEDKLRKIEEKLD